MNKEDIKKLWIQYPEDIEKIRQQIYDDAVNEKIVTKIELLRRLDILGAIYSFFVTEHAKYDAAMKNNKTAGLIDAKNKAEATDKKFVKGTEEIEVDAKLKGIRLRRNLAEAAYKSADKLGMVINQRLKNLETEKNKFN